MGVIATYHRLAHSAHPRIQFLCNSVEVGWAGQAARNVSDQPLASCNHTATTNLPHTQTDYIRQYSTCTVYLPHEFSSSLAWVACQPEVAYQQVRRTFLRWGGAPKVRDVCACAIIAHIPYVCGYIHVGCYYSTRGVTMHNLWALGEIWGIRSSYCTSSFSCPFVIE